MNNLEWPILNGCTMIGAYLPADDIERTAVGNEADPAFIPCMSHGVNNYQACTRHRYHKDDCVHGFAGFVYARWTQPYKNGKYIGQKRVPCGKTAAGLRFKSYAPTWELHLVENKYEKQD